MRRAWLIAACAGLMMAQDLAVRMDELSDEDYDKRMAALRAERDRFRALPATPDRTELVPTGQVVGDLFLSLGEAGRREMMLGRVRLYASKDQIWAEGDYDIGYTLENGLPGGPS